MPEWVTSPQPVNPTPIGFAFVRTLAEELSAGRVDIPSFPEVAVRVRRLLADPKSSADQITRVVGSEPALSARLLRIANSAALNGSGRTVTDLRTAINRIGFNLVRSASIAFAMAEIRTANKLAGLERPLAELWHRSTLVAAFAYVLGRSCSRVNPDEAMLAGMMHGIGELHVLTRSAAHPELFKDVTTLKAIIAEWHAAIGQAILENWEFSEEMALAIGRQHDHSRSDTDGAADLSDVLAGALMLATHSTDDPALEALLAEAPAGKRLGLDAARMDIVLRGCAEEVAALSNALAG